MTAAPPLHSPVVQGILLGDLFDEVPAGAAALRVRGITHDSRRVAPGDLYVAILGERFDGRDFVPQAVAAGAVAVLGPAPERASDRPPGVPWIVSDQPRRAMAPLATRLYGAPHRVLTTVGVTGTNGKSTVVALLARMLDAAGRPAATLGTLGYHFGDLDLAAATPTDGTPASAPLGRTTPEGSDLVRLLATARDAGARAAALEVSSHALDLGRVAGLDFDLGVLTNVSHDHLDFHGSMDAYAAAKARLFDQLAAEGKAVVGLGDPWSRALAKTLRASLGERLLTFAPFGDDTAETAASDVDAADIEAADVKALSAVTGLDGIVAEVQTPRGTLSLRSPLRGRFNLDNLLAAVAGAVALGLDDRAIVDAVGGATPLPGRLEPVERGQSFPAFVDYAHTPAALEAALTSARQLSDRKIVVVFGCGGDRDRDKRAPMGEIAGRGADLPVATSDNPRGEDPQAILSEVERGLRASGNESYRILPDRRSAIRRAVRAAAHGEARGETWLVLVAGKGHEATQEVGGERLPFDDREQLGAAIDEFASESGGDPRG